MKINILLAIFFSFLISCSQEKKSISPNDISTKLIEVDPKAAAVVKTSTLFDSILYIPLIGNEPTELIGEINKIKITEDYFYILDKKQKKICKYTIDGKFVNTIGKVGQGPGEYVSIYDFTLNKDEIVILDKNGRKILTYTTDGIFKKSYEINIMAQQIAATRNRYFLYTSGSDYFTRQKDKLGYNLFITDKECNIVKKLFKYNPSCENLQKDNVFDLYSEDNLYFNYALYDTIYQIQEDRISLKYAIDFKNSKIPISKVNKDNLDFYLNKSGYARILKTFHSKDYFIINYKYNNRVYLAINKKDKTYNISFLENDIDKTSFALPMPLCMMDNKVIFVKYANDLLEEYNSESIILNGENITIENNPVLVIGYLK